MQRQKAPLRETEIKAVVFTESPCPKGCGGTLEYSGPHKPDAHTPKGAVYLHHCKSCGAPYWIGSARFPEVRFRDASGRDLFVLSQPKR